jgi:transposase InsO family protein
MANQRKESAVAYLEAAVAYFAGLGVRVERVMTDKFSCHRSKMFRAACKRLGLRQSFIRPYTPKTNGKAERFIQTALREWAYAEAERPPYSTRMSRRPDALGYEVSVSLTCLSKKVGPFCQNGNA